MIPSIERQFYRLLAVTIGLACVGPHGIKDLRKKNQEECLPDERLALVIPMLFFPGFSMLSNLPAFETTPNYALSNVILPWYVIFTPVSRCLEM
jgi:hypothetical protein